MDIGVPKERRSSEYRVGITPAGVRQLTKRGHSVYIENGAGLGAGFGDELYEQAGGVIVFSPHEAFARAELILKVNRPLDEEIEWLQPGSTLTGFLHLPSARQSKIDTLLENEITTVAYEQIQLEDGSLPVLKPQSEIGGRMAPQIAAQLMQNDAGGKGILLGGMPGVPPAEVVIIGAGVAGSFAGQGFHAVGAQLTILDIEPKALDRSFRLHPRAATMFSTSANIKRVCSYADVVITSALVPGKPAPELITREILKTMKPRSIILDISIDQGGCVVTSRPTSHENPTFIEEDIIHYCVPNMPGAVARTSTHALQNAAIPYILEIAKLGIESAIGKNPAIAHAINTHKGEVHNILRLPPVTNE